MKILYVCHDPLPSESTSTEQLVRAAAAMASLGVRVTVTTPVEPAPPGELERRVAGFYGLEEEAFEGALELAPLGEPRLAPGPLRLPWHDVQAARFGRRGDFDLVYVRDPIALLAALCARKPVLFETYRYDLNHAASWAWWRAACYGSDRLVGVVTHSDMARRSFLERGFDEDAVLVAHNGFDPPPEGLMQKHEARAHLGLPAERPTVVYAGGVKPAKGLESILPVAEALPDVDIVVVGHVPGSADARWFEGLVREASVSNVRMVERVPPSEVHPWLAAADCLLIPTAASPLYREKRTVLPMKTFRYLGAGRPIVAPDLEDVGEILTDGENALLVPPDRPEATVAAVGRILKEPDLARRLACGARDTVSDLAWDRRAARILDFVRSRNPLNRGGV